MCDFSSSNNNVPVINFMLNNCVKFFFDLLNWREKDEDDYTFSQGRRQECEMGKEEGIKDTVTARVGLKRKWLLNEEWTQPWALGEKQWDQWDYWGQRKQKVGRRHWVKSFTPPVSICWGHLGWFLSGLEGGTELLQGRWSETILPFLFFKHVYLIPAKLGFLSSCAVSLVCLSSHRFIIALPPIYFDII